MPMRRSARVFQVSAPLTACVVFGEDVCQCPAPLLAALLCPGCAGSTARVAAPPRHDVALSGREHLHTNSHMKECGGQLACTRAAWHYPNSPSARDAGLGLGGAQFFPFG